MKNAKLKEMKRGIVAMLGLFIGLFEAKAQLNVNFSISLNSYETSQLVYNDVSEDYYIIGVPFSKKTQGLILFLEPAEALVEVYKKGLGGSSILVLKDYAPTAVEFTFSGEFDIIITYNNVVWRKTLRLSTGTKYIIGIPALISGPPASVIVETPEPDPTPPPPPPPAPAPAQPAQPTYDCVPMDPVEFSGLLARVEDADFEDDKMQIVRAAARNHCFTVNQVAQIAQAFEYDDDRLAVIKLLYPNIVDKADVYKLYDVFTFSSTREEFDEWLRMVGH